MNCYKGHIIEIKSSGHLSIVSVQVGGQCLKAIVIDTPDSQPYLHQGNEVEVLFKEMEVVLARSSSMEISLQNQIKGTLRELEKGQLLSRLVLETDIGELVAVISSDSIERMALQTGMSLVAMVKLNEVILAT